MIMSKNFREVIIKIGFEELREVMLQDGDYVSIDVCIFNAGWVPLIESCDYSVTLQEMAEEHGDLFCDKDDFVVLLEQHGFDFEEIMHGELDF